MGKEKVKKEKKKKLKKGEVEGFTCTIRCRCFTL